MSTGDSKSGTVPIVLVHGNPETDAVWDLLAERLVEAGLEEPVRLSPPGFGAPVPDGFSATLTAYREWLIAELEALSGPVDLVGHDLGSSHAIGVATTRPDLLRSWCVDGIGVLDPDYEWHELAQIWQTPGAGEEWIAANLRRSAEERASFLQANGMEASIATRVAAGFDEAMGSCILDIYRARLTEDAEVAADLEAAAARPGLAIAAAADSLVGTEEQKRRAAARAGAAVAVLPGHRHWWMTEHDARPAAEALTAFWTSLKTDSPA